MKKIVLCLIGVLLLVGCGAKITDKQDNSVSEQNNDTTVNNDTKVENNNTDNSSTINYRLYVDSNNLYQETLKKNFTLNNKTHELEFVYSSHKDKDEQKYFVSVLIDNELTSDNLKNVELASDDLTNTDFITTVKSDFIIKDDQIRIFTDNNKEYLLLEIKSNYLMSGMINYIIAIINDTNEQLYYNSTMSSFTYNKANGDLYFDKYVVFENDSVTIYKCDNIVKVSILNGKANEQKTNYPINVIGSGGC